MTGKYHLRMVKAPINQGVEYPALFQWVDPDGTEWYLVNGLRCSAQDLIPFLVKRISSRIGWSL